MDTEKHITLLGILHIIYSSLGLIAGVVVFTVFSGIGFLVSRGADFPRPGSFDVAALFWGLGTVIAALLVLFAIPGIIGGIGLLKRKEWARILVLIVGFFDLLHIPLGTILGIYTLWVLFNDQVIKLFRPQSATATQGSPPAA
jgi:hypothetical protein